MTKILILPFRAVGSALLASTLQRLLRGAQMRFVDHPAVEPHDPGGRILLEGIDNSTRVSQLLLRRGERLVDDIDMLRVNDCLRQESFAPRRQRFFA